MTSSFLAALRNIRLLAGPAALAGFFLPWTEGSGLLRGESFSGFELLRLAESLHVLDLPAEQLFSPILVRVLLLALPVAAVWFSLLAPALRSHWAYRASAAYLLLFTAAASGYEILVRGVILPAPGLALLICAALAIVVSALASRALEGQASPQTVAHDTAAPDTGFARIA